jgi:hypothetical protein
MPLELRVCENTRMQTKLISLVDFLDEILMGAGVRAYVAVSSLH